MITAQSIIKLTQSMELREGKFVPIYRDDKRPLYSLTSSDEAHSRLLENGRAHKFRVWEEVPYYFNGEWGTGNICSISSTEVLITSTFGIPWVNMKSLIKKASQISGIEYTGYEVTNIEHMTPSEGYEWLELRNEVLKKHRDSYGFTSKMSISLVPRDQLGWWDESPKEVVDKFLDKFPKLSGLERSVLFKLTKSNVNPKIFLEADQIARWYETGGRGNEFESELEWYNFEYPVYAPENNIVYRRIELSKSEYETLLSSGHFRLENSLLSSWTDEEGIKNFMPSNPRDYAIILITETRRKSLDLDATAKKYVDYLNKYHSECINDLLHKLSRGLSRDEREIIMEGNPVGVITLDNSKLLVKDSGGVRLVDHSIEKIEK
jgi:hypothetical protein